MSRVTLRTAIKKTIDQVPADRLPSLADFVAFLAQRPLRERVERAERDLKAGRGTPWRSVRKDV